GAGFSSVAVTAGRIFTMGDRGGRQFALAFNEEDGKALWATPIATPTYDDASTGPRGTPTIAGDLLYAISSEGDLVCLETATGRERWRKGLTGDFGGQMMPTSRFSQP